MYWSHFGLERQPFRAAVDCHSYFATPTHEDAIAAIAASFARRDGAVLLDGDTGLGKSLVARKWLENLLTEVPRIVVLNTQAASASALLQSMLFDLGKPYQGLSEQELRLSVTDWLLTAATDLTYPTVLILDEAQNLGQAAVEELRMLGNLETSHGPALFAVLVAQLTLRDVLLRREYQLMNQRIAARVSIASLTVEQSADYIRHQLRTAGGEPDELLDGDLVAMLASACSGVPRMLNRSAALAMELAANAGADLVDVEAGLEALGRLGLTVEVETAAPERSEDETAVLLPHPLRAAESSVSSPAISADRAGHGEDIAARGPKDRASRKRTV